MARFSPLAAGLGAFTRSLEETDAKKRAQQERLEDRIAQKEMRELQKRSLEQALATPKQVEWDTRETDNGFVQVNPVTGQTRPVTLDDAIVRPPTKEGSWQVIPDRGVRVQPATGKVEPIQGLPPAAKSEAQVAAQENRRLDRSRDLRADYEKSPAVKAGHDLARVAGGIQAGLSGQTPMDDLSLIYETVKLFDPQSVVREGEIKLFQSAASLPLQLRLTVERWNSGKLLTPGMRAHIAALVDRKVSESKAGVAPVQADFGKMAREYGVSADSAFIAPDPFRGVRSSKRSSLPNP